jgi:hypothetical protein
VATTRASHRYRPLARPLTVSDACTGPLTGHAGEGDVVERDRLVRPIPEHGRAVFLDGVVAPLEPVERGVELVRLDLDQEAEASEVDTEDGDGPLRDESQRAEHRPVAAEADQRVGLIDQLGLTHWLHVVG